VGYDIKLFCSGQTLYCGHVFAMASSLDPFSLMANAKNLPSQESLNAKMWPDNGVVYY
jgi:hypothetical protein